LVSGTARAHPDGRGGEGRLSPRPAANDGGCDQPTPHRERTQSHLAALLAVRPELGWTTDCSSVTLSEREGAETISDPSDGVFRLREEGLSWRALDGEVIALDLGESVYLSANSSGALLWEALARGATRADLEAILLEAYGLDPGRARSDVDAFLADAESLGLLA